MFSTYQPVEKQFNRLNDQLLFDWFFWTASGVMGDPPFPRLLRSTLRTAPSSTKHRYVIFPSSVSAMGARMFCIRLASTLLSFRCLFIYLFMSTSHIHWCGIHDRYSTALRRLGIPLWCWIKIRVLDTETRIAYSESWCIYVLQHKQI